MKAYHNMPLAQFVAQLRDAAIANNAGPIVIGLLDDLYDEPTLLEKEAEIEKIGDELNDMKKYRDELNDMEKYRDDLHEELTSLLAFIYEFSFTDEQADDEDLASAKFAARKALERNR